MKPQTTDIDCGDYLVKADIYDGETDGPMWRWSIGQDKRLLQLARHRLPY